MKTNNNSKKGLHLLQSFFKPTLIAIIFGGLVLTGTSTAVKAQEVEYTRPSWHFGVAAAGNINVYRGTTQELNDELTVPAAFRHGQGLGLYLAPTIEYYKPDTRFGFILQAGYDNRSGDFEQTSTPCNCPADLSTDLSYISIEPSLRFAPFKSDFYMYAGPRFAFNRSNSFEYQMGINPAYPEQTPSDAVNGVFSHTNKSLISMQIGAGYDIQLSSQNHKTQFVLSPFVSYHPYFGQEPRSIQTWDVNTLRLGVALKFGVGNEIIKDESNSHTIIPPKVAPEVRFTVFSPKNIPVVRRVKETFPIRNYVFFNAGETEIADRYVLINKDQVKDFKEDRLEEFAPKYLSGRSDREMVVYYNILNILGMRMNQFPNSEIKLTGYSGITPENGKLMAISIKNYLVEIFDIDESRIQVDGKINTENPSMPNETPKELTLLEEEARRVTIESYSTELLMEFQTGSDVPLKPVEIEIEQTAPIDSYVFFNVDGADEAFNSWSLEIADKKNIVQKFGPFITETASIPGKTILGTKPEGNFNIKMIGLAKNGMTVTKDTNIHMVLWVPDQNEQGMRFSVIYKYNDSESSDIYTEYLTEVVTPKIPKGGTVIIHGYTDIIGNDKNNKTLSRARANDVKAIMQKALDKSNRTDVIFTVKGFGEDISVAPFGNELPEERFYNRTVIIDIIPAK